MKIGEKIYYLNKDEYYPGCGEGRIAGISGKNIWLGDHIIIKKENCYHTEKEVKAALNKYKEDLYKSMLE